MNSSNRRSSGRARVLGILAVLTLFAAASSSARGALVDVPWVPPTTTETTTPTVTDGAGLIEDVLEQIEKLQSEADQSEPVDESETDVAQDVTDTVEQSVAPGVVEEIPDPIVDLLDGGDDSGGTPENPVTDPTKGTTGDTGDPNPITDPIGDLLGGGGGGGGGDGGQGNGGSGSTPNGDGSTGEAGSGGDGSGNDGGNVSTSSDGSERVLLTTGASTYRAAAKRAAVVAAGRALALAGPLGPPIGLAGLALLALLGTGRRFERMVKADAQATEPAPNRAYRL